MEATSARMAQRDRYGGFGDPVVTSPLQRFILNACDPSNYEPNLALNLEITDLINSKKGSAPREAATTIVSYVNHRNPNVAMLALELLDICVKNCGYPFHLQISTKDFLNELVRRFPERPPVRASKVQTKVLGLIEEWRTTICETSRYKEDLGFIRDMHRLLRFKGYIFPEVRKEDAAVLNSNDALKSAEEMEEEEKEAQSAKLQELIRRGGPQDLQEANRLMKVMAGYDTRNKTDWRAKAAEEVSKVQQKARLLEDMLQRHENGEQWEEGDVFDELANALISAHPKIQKMCEEESDDHEAVAKLLEINDSIHRTIERYKLMKKGDLEGASKIPKGTLGSSGAGVSKGPNNELSLIDFDERPAASSQPAEQTQPKGNALEDDLLGLSLNNNTLPGAISLGFSNGAAAASSSNHTPQLSNSQITSLFSQPQQSQQFPQPSQPSFFTASPPPSQQSVAQPIAQPPPPKADPFAALQSSSQNSRTASPFQFQQSTSALASKPPQNPKPAQHTQSTAQDDEWDFTSSLPVSTNPTLTLLNSTIEIAWVLARQNANIEIKSTISNNSALPVTDVTFQVAVAKAYNLSLQPQSSLNLAPNQRGGITQVMHLSGAQPGQAGSVRMRWKVSYKAGGQSKEENGSIDGLPAGL